MYSETLERYMIYVFWKILLSIHIFNLLLSVQNLYCKLGYLDRFLENTTHLKGLYIYDGANQQAGQWL